MKMTNENLMKNKNKIMLVGVSFQTLGQTNSFSMVFLVERRKKSFVCWFEKEDTPKDERKSDVTWNSFSFM